jgi:hypothetical protein
VSLDLVVFVEDPGAANFAAGLPEALAGRGRSARLYADGPARGYLGERGVAFEEPPVPEAAAVAVGTAESPDTAGLRLIAHARARGRPAIGLVDAPANAEHRFRGRADEPLAFAPDWILVPDEGTRERYVELGHPAGRVLAVGHPHWDAVRARARELDRHALRSRLFPDAGARPVAVFAAEVSKGLGGEQYRRSPEYTLHGRGERDGRTEVVLEELADALAELSPRPFAVLRLHPKNTRDELSDHLPAFDEVSEGGDPLELVYAADAVVGMTSSLVMEAALMGRPTLSIVPRAAELDWLPSVGAGLTLAATTRAELRSQLDRVLAGEAPAGPGPPEGALARTAEAIDTILSG